MKKSIFLAILIGLTSFASAKEMMEIECTIKPIDRSKIHGNSAPVQSTSTNWSGYVAAEDLSGAAGNGTVDYVGGSWVVPTLLPTTDDTYCAIWVGIDGYNSGSVEQIGTSHNWINGAQQNSAWFEMYPNASYEINGFPVDNGDVISARVGYKGNGVFQLVIFNHTKGVSTAIPTSYTTSTTALRSCAEWIVEAPYSGSILPLSDFQLTTLNYCSAIINGVHGVISNGSWQSDEIVMSGSSGVEAQTSGLLKDGSCFQVKWVSQ